MDMKDALGVDRLCFSYTQGDEILSDVSFDLAEGESVALVGPNGAGKTTLFMLLCGILKPKTGRITAAGKPVVPNRFNPQINYLFQLPDDQLFSTTVFDDVAFGPLNMSLSREEVLRRTEAALAQVGCNHLKDRPSHHLSGGEKRMIAIATILTMMPDIILFDEPTSNLDSTNRRKVIEIISGLGQTLLIASHDLEFLLEAASRVLLMDRGRIVAEGPIRDVLSDESLLRAHGLEKPHSLVHHSRVPHRHLEAPESEI
jgi:cobalt/nickel transport system ATP-binding protein